MLPTTEPITEPIPEKLRELRRKHDFDFGKWDYAIADGEIVLYDINTPLADVMDHAADWTKVYQDGLSVAFVPTDKLSTVKLPPVPRWAPGSVCARQLKAIPNTGAQNQ